MLAGDSLAVFSALLAFAGGTAVTAYSISDTKARNLWIVAGVFLFLAALWLVRPLGMNIDPARALQYLLLAMPLLVVSLVALMLRDRRPIALDESPKQDSRNWRKNMISIGRDLAVRYTNDPRKQNFRHFLEQSSLYPHLRKHLSKAYLDKLNAPRTVYAPQEGSKYEALVEWFLDELDRLEQEWGLR